MRFNRPSALRWGADGSRACLRAAVVLALLVSGGCWPFAPACPDGTVEVNGKCGAPSALCGAGTHFANGTCVVDADGGSTNRALDGGGSADALSADSLSADSLSADTLAADGGGNPDSNGCVANCDGRTCGDNGCGGTCGSCATATPYCVAGQCVAACTPSCAGASCGADGCGGTCGTCDKGATCTANGQCAPSAWTCSPASYGGDGVCDCACGDADPDCAQPGLATKNCKATEVCKGGICFAGPPAAWACAAALYGDGTSCECQCGAPDPDCAAGKSVSNCASGTCAADGKACGPCKPDCTGKTCGPDGCGAICGSCLTVAAPICDGGVCSKTCTPKCSDKTCGDDGCGGVCGVCAKGKHCSLDHCQVLPKDLSCVGQCGKTSAGGCSCASGCIVGLTCCADVKAACGCQPSCSGKTCGKDGCGGVCGTCKAGNSCQAGACVADLCSAATCGGKGACKDGLCTCLSGYGGKSCGSCALGFTGFPICVPDLCLGQTCGGKGTCDAKTGKCTCSKDFTGQLCQQCVDGKKTYPACDKPLPACAGKMCGGQGVCDTKTDKCVCSSGFTGVSCEKCSDTKQTWPKCGDGTCSLPCSGHGGCVSPNSCFCAPGFSGANCELCVDKAKTWPTCGGAQNANYAPDLAVAGVNCSFCGEPLAKISVTPNAADKTAPQLKVLLPPSGSVIAAGMPLVVVIDDVVDPKTVTPKTLIVHPSGSPTTHVAGSVVAQVTTNKNTVIVFVPSNMTLAGSYTIRLEGIKDLGGNVLALVDSKFNVGGWSPSSMDANLSFESGAQSCFFAGDGALVSASDNLKPTDGNAMLALTTANKGTVGKTSALGGQVSVAFCGPITVPKGKTTVSFDYNFASSEFDEYVGQQFDDLAIAVLSGGKGGVGGVVTSVNMVGKTGKLTKAFGLPDEGDAVAKMSGWKTATINAVGGLGSQLYLTFIVSDVADTSYTSVFVVDHVQVK